MKPRFKTSHLSPTLCTICFGLSVAGFCIQSAQAQTNILNLNPAAVTQTVASTSGSSTLTVADGTAYSVGDIIRFTASGSSPFGSANNYYIVSVSGNDIEVSATPGGAALNATATQAAGATQLSQDLSAAATWTGGNIPDDNSEIMLFNNTSGSVPAFIVTQDQTIYGFQFNGSGSDLVLASGADGTDLHTLTFATNDASTPKISFTSSSRIVRFGTGNGEALKIGGTQGLIFNGRSGGALTGTGVDATSGNPAKNFRLSEVDWSEFSGGVTIEQGEVNIQGTAGNLPTNQTLTVGNAQTTTNNTLAHLAMGNFGQTVDGLNGTSLGRISGNSTLSVGNANGSGDYAGVIGRGMTAGDTNTNLEKNGNGTQTISGIMVGGGAVTVNGGTLAMNGANTYTGTTTVNDGGTLSLGGSLTGGGALAVNGSGILSQSAAGVISGASAITLGGSGTSTLYGANTYTGLTTIGNGTTLKLGSATALGSSGVGGDETAINGGGTLDLNGQTIAETFTDNGGKIINSNTSTAAAITTEMVNLGNPTFDGPGDITVDNIRRTNGVTRRITKDGAGTLTLGGNLDNNRYGLTVNDGNVILAKTAGEAVGRFELIMNGGNVTLSIKGDQISDSNDIIHKINAGTLDLNGFNEGLSAIEGAAGIVTNSAGSSSTLTLGHSNAGGFDGVFDGAITGNLDLIKTGSNTQTLNGASSYTGTTTINGGTLKVGNTSALGTGVITLESGGTLDVNGNVVANAFTANETRGTLTNTGAAADYSGTNIVNNGSFTLDGTGNLTLGNIGGSSGAAIVKNGSNTVTLSGTADNGYLAATVNAGTLILAKDTGTSSHRAIGGGVIINSGGTVQLAGDGDQIYDPNSVVINEGTFDVNTQTETINSLQIGDGTTNGSVTGTSGVLSVGGGGIAAQSGSVSAILGGSADLTKTTSGTVTLSGANTYSGLTTISEGTLALGASGSIDSSSGVVLNGGNFNVSAVSGYTLGASQSLSGSGGSVTGDITIDGNLTIGASPGTITFDNDLSFGSGSVSDFEFTLATFTLGSYDLALGGLGTQSVAFDGTLNLFFDLGESYTLGSSVQIFDFENYSGNFSALNFSGLAVGQSATFDAATGFVTVIPEPSAALFGGLGLLALLRRRRN